MKILVLGGGISGLSALWHLSKLLPDAEVTLLEKSNRLGGWIQTGFVDGFLFEQGPRTFSSARSPSLLRLITDVGLEKDLLFSLPNAKKRYLWHRGKLKSVGAALLPHAWRLLCEPFIAKGGKEETIHAFASRRFGKQIANLLFDPLTLGVFAGDSRALSMQASFPKLAEMEERSGSLLVGMLGGKKKKPFPGSLFTLKQGMESLVDALFCRLKANILLNTEVISLAKQPGGWLVETKEDAFRADALFSALPAPSLSSLMPGMPKIPSASLTVVNLGFFDLALSKSGYGYLVPSLEREEVLGMIFDSDLFGGSGCRLTAMVRPTAKNPEEAVLGALSRHLQIRRRPDRIETHRATEAIPQLGIGQKQALLRWEASLDDFFLLGNFCEGPGVEQCVARSEIMVNKFLEKKFRN